MSDALLNNLIQPSEEQSLTDSLQYILSEKPSYLQYVPNLPPEQVIHLESLSYEGEIHRKELDTYKQYYAKLNPTTLELYLYASKESSSTWKQPLKTIPVYYSNSQKARTEDAYYSTQLKQKNTDVCTRRLSIYSENRTYIFSTPTDDDMQKLEQSIQSILEFFLTPDQKQKKKAAAETLAPIQNKQIQKEKEQFKLIVTALQSAGIFPERLSGKRREGYLEMQKPDGSWKKYYFVLFKETLSYFNIDERVMPRGVILIESITFLKKLPPQPRRSVAPVDNMDIDEANGNQVPVKEKPPRQPFEIHTPLRKYILRAKHEEAMVDWVLNILEIRGPNQVSVELVTQMAVQRNEVTGGTQLVPMCEKKVTYKFNGKEKSFKFKKPSMLIGRSTKADVCVPDPKMSRNHARIEVNANNVAVLYDMGSLGGTFDRNGEKVTKIALLHDDRFTLGTTLFHFRGIPQEKKNI